MILKSFRAVLPAPKQPANPRRKKTDAGMLLPLPHSLITLGAEQLRHVHLAGAQLRYLARSGGEVVGALGFGARAWLVAGRDRFIGW